MKPVRFAQVGIGGFGRSHLHSITALEKEGLGKLDSVVIRSPKKYTNQIKELSQRGVRILNSLEELLNNGGIDIIALPTGIQFHVPQTLKCVQTGYDVLCEKPIAAVIQEADRMIAAEKETGRMIVIGYQAISTPAIQKIKTRIIEEALGKIQSIHVKGGWPRDDIYYNRNTWAARLKDGDEWILDSPINNAFAHDLNNPLYLCGPTHQESATPTSIQAEFYRARNIESLDTASLRILTTNGVKIVIALSHVTRENFNPSMVIKGENGTVHWSQDNGATTITYFDGTKETFDNGGIDSHHFPFFNAVKAFRGQANVLCTPENSRSQTICINGAHECCPKITKIPEKFIEEIYQNGPNGEKTRFLVVQGLDELMHRSFDEGKLFSELNSEWSSSTEPFDLTDYEYFPSKTASFY
mgnify:CR=1 FL=1